MSDRAGRLFAAGLLSGLAVGFVAWSVHQHTHRRDLFSPRRLRRLAALGHLGGRRDLGAARLLGDYVRWETNPALKRRGRQLLDRAERRFA